MSWFQSMGVMVFDRCDGCCVHELLIDRDFGYDRLLGRSEVLVHALC